MSRGRIISPLLLFLLLSVTGTHSQTRRLTFEERVSAQRAIERVYYAHLVGANRPFEEAVPSGILEKKVRAYLRQSAALERFWKTPVTAEALEAELARISSSTRLPERLEELFKALDDDPFVIQECLARASLVDRLARSFFGADERVHGAERREAEELRDRLVRGDQSTEATDSRRTLVELRLAEPGQVGKAKPVGLRNSRVAENGIPVLELEQQEFSELRGRAPRSVGTVGPTREEQDAFVIDTVLAQEEGSATIATYTVPKKSWDTWWGEVEGGLDESSVETVASSAASLLELPRSPSSVATSGPESFDETQAGPQAALAPCQTGPVWWPSTYSGPPTPRSLHTAIWTGANMIVWGGWDGYMRNDGGRYDPITDTWKPISTIGAPAGRITHSAIWTGDTMIVFGGWEFTNGYLESGGRYDPLTDSWSPTSLSNAPSSRAQHTTVWTGTEMIIWGGQGANGPLASGGRYEPITDTWATLPTAGAPPGRDSHTSIWTGEKMIVWGGKNGTLLNDGRRYDPKADTWTPISTTGAPYGRFFHTAVWTGTEMIIWGGQGASGQLASGGRYEPITDTWATLPTAGAPSGRYSHTSIWTGEKMIVWGGVGNFLLPNPGGIYDPVYNTWNPTSSINAPSERYDHTAVWTGATMIIWGGYDAPAANGGANFYLESGGRYNPSTNTWTPTSSSPDRASSLVGNANRLATVWTGAEMIVWDGKYLNGSTGARYDPMLDRWRPTSTAGEPTARVSHTSIWTGEKMIVWGGVTITGFFALNSGGIYDPVADTWNPTSAIDAPSARDGHTAVWTGNRMVVWGGFTLTGSNPTNTGGMYDLVTNTWTPTSTTGAPTARFSHTGLWTGQKLIVWGGYDGLAEVNTGGVYDPMTNIWRLTSTVSAPTPRSFHAATWTGDTMIVWGGSGLNTGGRYDPVADSWLPTSTANAPLQRTSPVVMWTGRSMLVWGGVLDSSLNTSSGAFYDPSGDTWTALSAAGPAYSSGADHAVWTGAEMILWQPAYGTTSRLAIVLDDDDSDGYNVCEGDCNDRDGSIYPGAIEMCDNLDNNCDRIIDSFATQCGTYFCPSAGFCAGGLDSCQPSTCGFAVTKPAHGSTLSFDTTQPPEFKWDPGSYDQFKIYIYWDPALSQKRSINSGSAYIRTTAYTPNYTKWNKAYLQALKTGGNLYVRILGKSGATGEKKFTEVVSLQAGMVVITAPTSTGDYFTDADSIDISGGATNLVPVSGIRWYTDRVGSGNATGKSSWKAPAIPLECGANRITVTATNTSGTTGTDTLVVHHDSARCTDTVPPSIEITSPIGPTYTTGAATLALTGMASDNISITRVDWMNDRGGSGTAAGRTSWSIPQVSLQCGTNLLSVTAEDNSGNHRTETLRVSRVSSTCTPPSVTITFPTSATTHLTYVSPLMLTGTASDNSGVSSVTWSNSRGGNGTATGTFSWSTAGIVLLCGTNVLRVTAIDTDGNSGSDAISVFYQCVDNVSPQIAIVSPTSNPTFTTGTNPLTLGGTASDNISVQSVTWSNSRGGAGTATGTVNWSAAGIPLKCGSNLLMVTAHDPSFNTATDTLNATYTESVAPAVAITSPTTSTTFATSTNTTLVFGGTASDNFGLPDITWTRSYNGSVVSSGTASMTTSWSASTLLQCGTNILMVTAHDQCGNSSSSDTLTVVPELTYISNTQTIFTNSCIRCHSATSTPRVNLSTYQAVYANRIIVRAKLAPATATTQAGTMRGNAGDANSDIVIRWIDQCAPQ